MKSAFKSSIGNLTGKKVLLLILMAASLSYSLNFIISLIIVKNPTTELTQATTEINLMKEFLTLVIWAPFWEEIIFRGVLFSGLWWIFKKCKIPMIGAFIAAISTSFLFGYVHMNLPQSIFCFLMALFMCNAYVSHNTIIATIIVHFTSNLLSFILTLIPFDVPLFVQICLLFLAFYGIFYGGKNLRRLYKEDKIKENNKVLVEVINSDEREQD